MPGCRASGTGGKTKHRCLAAEFPTSVKHHTDRAQLFPFAGATRVSCHGCFPECSVGLTPVSALERRSPRQVAPRSPGHCRASRYISGGARPILPEASRGRPRSLGTGGREEGRGVGSSERAERSRGRAVVSGTAAAGERCSRPAARAVGLGRSLTWSPSILLSVFAGALEFSFPKRFLHN